MNALEQVLARFHAEREKVKSALYTSESFHTRGEIIGGVAREIARELMSGRLEVTTGSGSTATIELCSLEFYYHDEFYDGVQDPVMYHTNLHIPSRLRKKGMTSYPYFTPGSLNLHSSGIDITFEHEGSGEDRDAYRAAFLIRAYRMEGETGADWCSTHIYDDLFPNGVPVDGNLKVEFIPGAGPAGVTEDVRLNVPYYYWDVHKGPVKMVYANCSDESNTKNGRYVQDPRMWQFNKIL